MSRIVFKKGKQKEFLDKVQNKSKLEWFDIAHLCNVSERTLRDWRREKFYMKYESAKILSRKSAIILCRPKNILPDYWSTKKAAPIGAKRRYRMYGNPGTPEGRKKGGVNSQIKFKKNPEYAKKLSFKIRKIIKKPKHSSSLSEFIGILLGDGGMTKYQVVITFNRETDAEHASYIRKMIKKLFNIKSSVISNSGNDKASNIVISSRSLVDFLFKKGIAIGNKLRKNIDIPQWIKRKKEYKITCVRGLMDTDGSFYFYKHKVNGKIYNDFAICFTSYSKALISSVYKILKEIKLTPSRSKIRVYLYRKNDIEKYMQIVNTNNPKHLNKYSVFEKERYRSGYNGTVLKTV